MKDDSLRVKVWGDWACFSRPEMKVERVSYEVMTPSVARGMLESILWKPEMQWEVRAIEVLRPIRFHGFVRNEVAQKANPATALRWAQQKSTGGGFFVNDRNVRTQRHTLALRDVAYILVADVRVLPGAGAEPAKYRDQFRRRLQRGQYHSTPYLGCREFAAFFSEPGPDDHPLPISADLGRMLFDIEYQSDESGQGHPRFFEAQLEQGVLHIPAEFYEQRRRRQYAPATP